VRILVADDEPNLLKSIGAYFRAEGIEAALAPDGMVARSMLADEAFDAAVLDIRMPGLDGLSLLRWIREEGPAIPVIMMSAHGDVKDAVEAMRLGAGDYLVKPFDPDELVIRTRRAVRERRLDSDREAAHRPEAGGTTIIGTSPAMLEAVRLVDKAAPTPATILITGESGTGKEVIARLVHERSGRQGAFVAVNLGALPETLLESELFGYEKGAFTGAAERKRGLFELADGGTLFLDEIGEMPPHLQVKLLRAIQERKVMRLGGIRGLPFDARIVAATNRDLEAMVRDGSFREDLYYRVNVVRIALPPLRERPGDVALLAEHFVETMAPRLGRRHMTLAESARRALAAHSFPGNVRELVNAVERAIILADGDVLEEADLRLGVPGGQRPPASPPATPAATDRAQANATPRTLDDIEREAILAALERNGGRREATAAELGISRRTLLNKLTEYGAKLP